MTTDFSTYFALLYFALELLNFDFALPTFFQKVSLNPNCTVRGAYQRLGLDTGCPYPGLVSVTLYVE